MEQQAEQTVERRQFARLDIALSVSFVIKDESGEATEIAEAMSTDISASGIRLMSPVALENGATMDMEISIEGSAGEPVHATGEVVWQSQVSTNSYETGVVIRYMDDQNKKRFLDFVFHQMLQLVGMESNLVH